MWWDRGVGEERGGRRRGWEKREGGRGGGGGGRGERGEEEEEEGEGDMLCANPIVLWVQ